MKLFMKQKQTHRYKEQTLNRLGNNKGCQGVVKGGREGLGVWNQQIQTIACRMDRQQVLLWSTWNYIQYSVNMCKP